MSIKKPLVPSISLCMIVKNVEKTIERTLGSILPHVDEVVITDTGSTDRTAEIIEKQAGSRLRWLTFLPHEHPEAFVRDSQETWPDTTGIEPFSERIMLADFGAARQFGWERAQGDYLIWIDGDDVFQGGPNLRNIIATLEKDRNDTALLHYDYASDERGNVTCKLTRERIVKKSANSRWHNPIHEVLLPIGRGRLFDECSVKHIRQEYNLQPEVQHRNLKVLLKWFEKNKDNPDPRMLFYLGMEERFLWPHKAVERFKHYCEISGWDEERGIAHYLMANIHERSGNHKEALADYGLAALEAHWNPDPLFGAARIAYYKKDWEKCIEWTRKGFEVDAKSSGRKSALMYDPLDRLYRPYIFYSAALIESGHMKDALEACEKGLKYNQQDPHLIGNKEVAEAFLKGKAKERQTMSGNLTLRFKADEPLEDPPVDIPSDVMITFALQMWKRNMAEGLYAKALNFIDSLPVITGYDAKIRSARELTISKMEKLPTSPENSTKPIPQIPAPVAATTSRIEIPQGKLNILLWTGPAWEDWGPRSLDTTGIGGSETAAVCMARELAKIGHQVTVLSQCGSEEGTHDGVKYVHYERAIQRPQDYPSDIFISSRHPHVFEYPFQFKASFIWVHDIHVGHHTSKLGEMLLKADRFLCLSEWHKDFFLHTYPFIHKDSVIVTKNGIDLKYFKEEPAKIGNRMIYSSSPDRGLERLLDLLPRIRDQVPDTELHIYYGFHNWKKMAEAFQNQDELQRIGQFERLIDEKTKEGGVFYHGRVSKQELANAYLSSKVWPYPTWFTESYCIAAIEAQAAGCVPVATALAALPETISHGFVLKPPNTSANYEEAFVKRVVTLLKDDTIRLKYAKAGREYAFQNHSWSKVALSWEKYFHDVLKSKAENPLPTFGDF